MRIVFIGGGTGGHVFPIIAVAREIRRAHPDAELFYVGPRGVGTDAFLREGISVRYILGAKFPRYFTPRIFLELLKFPFAVFQSFWSIYWLMPDIVFGKGGYGSFASGLATQLFLIPLFIHESDAVFGFANSVLARFAKKIFVSFSPPPLQWASRALVTGNPVRLTLAAENSEQAPAAKAAARTEFGLVGGRPLVVVLGGSQGARQINDLIIAILKDVLLSAELIHQCGVQNFNDVDAETRVELTRDLAPLYHLVPFLEDEAVLRTALAACDLVVSRAGSGSIFEIALAGKPSIIIPLLSAAGDHQRANARLYAESGACFVLDSPNLTPHLFLGELRTLLGDEGRLAEMGHRAASFARPEAAAAIAAELLRG